MVDKGEFKSIPLNFNPELIVPALNQINENLSELISISERCELLLGKMFEIVEKDRNITIAKEMFKYKEPVPKTEIFQEIPKSKSNIIVGANDLDEDDTKAMEQHLQEIDKNNNKGQQIFEPF
uniref:Uncharacterized protein n=1 Tax=viral metagenome TaxID=1070528 RepID=A0A6M3KSM3_9ZZZZ